MRNVLLVVVGTRVKKTLSVGVQVKKKTCNYSKRTGHIQKDFRKRKKTNFIDDERYRDITSNVEASYSNVNDDGDVLVATHKYKSNDEWIIDY